MSEQHKIFIDPGHGGRDPGAVGNNLRESDINLAVSLRLGELLRAAGVDVRFSRTTDTLPVFAERARSANTWGADYFVSVHANAGGGTGGETFIAATKPQDRPFAQAINDPYCAAMGLRNRGVKLDSVTPRGRFDALRSANMPAILVELAFIDSPLHNPDVPILRNRRNDMAQALADALLSYLGVAQTQPPATDIPATVPGEVDDDTRLPSTGIIAEHIVVAGDNLWSIACKHYGGASANAVNAIFMHNRVLLDETAIRHGHANSNAGALIFPGTVLQIPER
ncbi:MAG: N-acetylmuramoyl-L-alanine amidase [Oscillospiraceae bacterium]|jgi:N-acetylmuramoyl-L-alanine amidase|nr:N-acetylmuramoyl-L-alanine amidase [Oscillospiraceae bacterium]